MMEFLGANMAPIMFGALVLFLLGTILVIVMVMATVMAVVDHQGRAGIVSDIERMYAHFPVLKQRHTQQAGTLSGGQTVNPATTTTATTTLRRRHRDGRRRRTLARTGPRTDSRPSRRRRYAVPG